MYTGVINQFEFFIYTLPDASVWWLYQRWHTNTCVTALAIWSPSGVSNATIGLFVSLFEKYHLNWPSHNDFLLSIRKSLVHVEPRVRDQLNFLNFIQFLQLRNFIVNSPANSVDEIGKFGLDMGSYCSWIIKYVLVCQSY